MIAFLSSNTPSAISLNARCRSAVPLRQRHFDKGVRLLYTGWEKDNGRVGVPLTGRGWPTPAQSVRFAFATPELGTSPVAASN